MLETKEIKPTQEIKKNIVPKQETYEPQRYLGSQNPPVEKAHLAFNVWKLFEGKIGFESSPNSLSKVFPYIVSIMLFMTILVVLSPFLAPYAFGTFVVILIVIFGIVIFNPERTIFIKPENVIYGDKNEGVVETDNQNYTVIFDSKKDKQRKLK